MALGLRRDTEGAVPGRREAGGSASTSGDDRVPWRDEPRVPRRWRRRDGEYDAVDAVGE